LRFVTATTLAALLLSPLIKSLLTDTKKPVVVLAQDQSESVMGEMDETELQAYKTSYETLKSSLAEKYDLKEYAFGSEVREGVDFSFTDKVSNLSEMLKSLYDLVYAGNRLGAPIFTVALGDTTPQRDLLIKRVYHNKIAYLGDKFNIEVDVLAQNCPNTKTNLVISKIENGQTKRLQNSPININRNDFFITEEVTLEADKAGVQRFRVAVNSVEGEVTTTNNVKDIFIDVLDARQKILMIAQSPHPDLTAIKQSLIDNKNYEIKVEYAGRRKANIADYNFVILHQLPGIKNDAADILQQIEAKKLPHLFIVGSQSNLTTLNNNQSLLTINGDSKNANEVQGIIANDFSIFTVDDATKDGLPNGLEKLKPNIPC